MNVPYPVIYRTPLKSFVMKRMLIICRNVTLTCVKHVGRERRVVVPARTPSFLRAHFVTYRPRDGMFTARAAVSNASQEQSDEALGKSIATADRNEVVFPADTVFPQRPDKTHHYIPYYI